MNKKDKCVRCQSEIEDGVWYCKPCFGIMKKSPAVAQYRTNTTIRHIYTRAEMLPTELLSSVISFIQERNINPSFIDKVIIGLQLAPNSNYCTEDGILFRTINGKLTFINMANITTNICELGHSSL